MVISRTLFAYQRLKRSVSQIALVYFSADERQLECSLPALVQWHRQRLTTELAWQTRW